MPVAGLRKNGNRHLTISYLDGETDPDKESSGTHRKPHFDPLPVLLATPSVKSYERMSKK